ncbi:uncharacterized protein LOC141640026 [Silene latifolia]|uniref:uncharacterized protein LOC141640026 n=1 Tax=Silene latifolia TaxID=37657 RepID=UPI003D789028
MQKLTDKVGPAISKETDFVNRLNAIVWDAELEPLKFEEKWSHLRHTQKQLDKDDNCTLPQLSTSLKLESHASKVYTHSTFVDFQLEATAYICSLSVGGFTPPANNIEVIGIADARTQKTYQVVYNSTNNDPECSCKLFNRKVDQECTQDLRKLEMCKLWSEFYATISVLKNVPTNEITDLVDTLKQFRVKLNPQSEPMTKEQELEILLGCSSSTEVRILPPRQAKNKGSGKRMISKKQQCIAKVEKPKRLCRNCKQMAHRDKRNCPNAFVPMLTIRYAHHDKSVYETLYMRSTDEDAADDG